MPPRRRKLLKKLQPYVVALGLLCAGGALLARSANELAEQQQETGLHPKTELPETRDALSQQLAFFTLGGMRSLAAEVLSLDATDAWSKRDWPRALRRWESVTTLAPRRVNYWISAAHDMTNNAAGDVACDRKKTRLERILESREYIAHGERFLLNGVANNPDSWQMHIGLAEQYGNMYRHPQFRKATVALRRGLQLGAPEHYELILFYNLCRIPGAEQEAWQLGRALWDNEDNRVPSLQFLLFVLQNKIEVPQEQALSVDTLYRNSPFETEQEVQANIIRNFRLYLHNDLLYPVNGVAEYLQQIMGGIK